MAESVSHYIERFEAGDADAAGQLWRLYFDRLVRLGRRFLAGTNRSFADEEDVALSAFASFCRRAGGDGFAALNDRDDLWQLLALITRRKARDLHDYHGRVKREAALTQGLASDGEEVACPRPPPDLAVEMAEQVERLLRLLQTDELRQVALWRMEGRSNGEIGGLRDRNERTVERKVWILEQIWAGEAGGDGPDAE
jgi:DNA-directed RNA polymerase specialized sigma24 family protein